MSPAVTTRVATRYWPAYTCWWVWLDNGDGGLMYKAVMDDYGNLVRVSEVV